MRPASALAPLLLVACGQADTPPAAADNLIECRAGGAARFERVCTIERSGRALVARKPDGGFRRFLLTRDGRGVVAGDGAEPARMTILADDRIEVEIGGDRFRLPASELGR